MSKWNVLELKETNLEEVVVGVEQMNPCLPYLRGKKIISVNEKKRKIKKEIYQEVVEVVVHWCLFHLQ